MVPCPIPYDLHLPKIWGSQPHAKTAIPGTAKAADCKFSQYIHRVNPNTNPWNILEKTERGRIQGLSKFFEYPLLSQERVKLRIWPRHSQGPSKQKPIKNFGGKGALAYPGTAEFFSIPLIISGTGKATNFQFCTHILSIDRNKRPLRISGKVAVGVVWTHEVFQSTHILGTSRGRICDSSAFLFSLALLCQFTNHLLSFLSFFDLTCLVSYFSLASCTILNWQFCASFSSAR